MRLLGLCEPIMKQQLDECRTLAIRLFEAGESEKRKQPKQIWGGQTRRWSDLPTESVAVWDAIALSAFDYFRRKSPNRRA